MSEMTKFKVGDVVIWTSSTKRPPGGFADQPRTVAEIMEEGGDHFLRVVDYGAWFLHSRFSAAPPHEMSPDFSLDEVLEAQEVFKNLQVAKG